MNDQVDLIEPAPRAASPAALRAGLSGPVTLQDRRSSDRSSFLARFWRKGRAPLQARRDPCYIVAVLMLLDRNLALDGLVTGINANAVTFRQASTFIFDRTGAEVSLRFGDFDRRGKIVDVTAHGYLIQLTQPLADDDVASLLYDYGQ